MQPGNKFQDAVKSKNIGQLYDSESVEDCILRYTEPHCEKTCLQGCRTGAVQPQKMGRFLKIWN